MRLRENNWTQLHIMTSQTEATLIWWMWAWRPHPSVSYLCTCSPGSPSAPCCVSMLTGRAPLHSPNSSPWGIDKELQITSCVVRKEHSIHMWPSRLYGLTAFRFSRIFLVLFHRSSGGENVKVGRLVDWSESRQPPLAFTPLQADGSYAEITGHGCLIPTTMCA